MDRRRLFPGSVLALLVLMGWWVLNEDPAPPPETAPQPQERRPDYFMEDFTMLATDQQGLPAWELTAPRMVHFIDDDTWELDRPDILYHMQTGQPWRMTADRGRAWDGLDRAMLEGKVRFRREAGKDNPEEQMDTSEVELRPGLRQADTAQPVIYRSPGIHVEGIGAHGDFSRDILNVHSEVKARYEPPAP